MKKLSIKHKLICSNEQISKLRESYAKLREEYLYRLEFDANLLEDAKRMNEYSLRFRYRQFLDFNNEHLDQLAKMKKVIKYLYDNPIYWDYRIVEAYYNQIPLQDERS